MGTDFFDGLGETLTRTARELGERAEQIYETQKIRNKISTEERIVEKLMADMGNLLYRRYKSGEEIDGEFCTFCEEIDQHFRKIKEYKGDAADLKGKKICPSCEKAVDREVSFCPYCGTACPDPEKTEETNETDAEDCAENDCTTEDPDNAEGSLKEEDICEGASETEEINEEPSETTECECGRPQEKSDCGSGNSGE